MLLLAVALLYGLLSFFTSMQIDDLLFAAIYRNANGGPGFSWTAQKVLFTEMWSNDNARLSNQLLPYAVLPGFWQVVFPWLTGVCCAAMVWLAVRLSDGRPRWCWAAVAWAVIMVLIPWRDSIFVPDYALNYIYPTVVNLLWLIALERYVARKGGALATAGMALFGVVAGWWHEGFTVPICMGLVAVWLMARCRRPWRWYLATVVYAVAGAAFALSPGMLLRFSNQAGGVPMAFSWIKLIIDEFPIILMLVALPVALSVSRWRRPVAGVFREPLFLILFVASLAGALLSITVTHTPRQSFFPDYCAIVCLLRMAWLCIGNRAVGMNRGWFALLFAGCVALMIHIVAWQYRFWDENNRIMAQFMEKPSTGTVFYDIIMPESLPKTTLYIPVRKTWTTPFQYTCLNEYAKVRGSIVVPESLRHPYVGHRVFSSDSTIYITGNALWTHDIPDLFILGDTRLRLTFEDGRIIENEMALASRFISGDGDTLVYIKPLTPSIEGLIDLELTRYESATPEIKNQFLLY